ncbi:MAG: hypothetical protein JKX88_08205, partial [Marinicaulis sp.]|nr:hypothetical protein [Marinicaulis sp.]
LLATGRTWDLEKAIKLVSKNLIEAIPGDPWKGEGGAAVSFPPSALPSLNADAAQTGIKVVEKCK